MDCVIDDAMISRQHCVIDYEWRKGGVYVTDFSTNGTVLNGKRLPPHGKSKVFLAHGDELLFKVEKEGISEFGYVVNLVANETV